MSHGREHAGVGRNSGTVEVVESRRDIPERVVTALESAGGRCSWGIDQGLNIEGCGGNHAFAVAFVQKICGYDGLFVFFWGRFNFRTFLS